jgi:hypothetical protein
MNSEDFIHECCGCGITQYVLQMYPCCMCDNRAVCNTCIDDYECKSCNEVYCDEHRNFIHCEDVGAMACCGLQCETCEEWNMVNCRCDCGRNYCGQEGCKKPTIHKCRCGNSTIGCNLCKVTCVVCGDQIKSCCCAQEVGIGPPDWTFDGKPYIDDGVYSTRVCCHHSKCREYFEMYIINPRIRALFKRELPKDLVHMICKNYFQDKQHRKRSYSLVQSVPTMIVYSDFHKEWRKKYDKRHTIISGIKYTI